MYKIKRFSQCTVSELDVRWFSCKENQKEFNIVGDLYRKGKGLLNKSIINTRNKVSNRLLKSIDDVAISSAKSNEIRSAIPVSRNMKIDNELLKESNSINSRVIKLPKHKGSSNVGSNDAKVLELDKHVKSWYDETPNSTSVTSKRYGRKVRNAIEKNDDIILYNPIQGTATLAHELGHIKNKKSKNPLRKFISKYSNDPNRRGDFNSLNSQKESGIKNIGKRVTQGLAIVSEEHAASKNALELMKKHGASKEELNTAKRILELDGKSYKDRAKWNILNTLRNTIKPE